MADVQTLIESFLILFLKSTSTAEVSQFLNCHLLDYRNVLYYINTATKKPVCGV